MIRRNLWRLNCFALVLAAISVPAVAAPTSVPAGPWITPNQNVSLEGFENYEQLTAKLQQIEKRSKGLVEIESVAVTNQGRDVWLVKVGDPENTPVLIMTQQHGNEPHGTEAAIDVIKTLTSGAGRSILDELYVLIIPRVNPDGSELSTRGNTNFDTPPRNSRDCFDEIDMTIPDQLDEGRGVFSTTFVDENGDRLSSYDINRYHWPDWSQSWQILCNPTREADGTPDPYDASLNPVPEARGVRKAYDDYAPIWVMDVHNQGSAKVVDDVAPESGNRAGWLITSSILWPTNEDVAEVARDLSKQLTVVIKQRSLELGYFEVTNYLFRNSAGAALRGGGFAGIARNAYGLLGTERIFAGELGPVGGSILVEIRGQGQKSIGMLKNAAREAMMAVLEQTADGSLFAIDPSLSDTLLPPGDLTDDFIGNPRNEEEADESEPE